MDKKNEVFRYIDNHKNEIVELLKEFVRFPTINDGDSIGNELPLQEYIFKLLNDQQFDEVIQAAYDEKKIRPNVIGKLKGSGGGKSLAFMGHSDVVPVNFPDRWVCPPFEPAERDGKLYGRGTSDMKGGLAAAFFALKAIQAVGIQLKGDVVFHSSVGEESQSAETIGAERALKDHYHTDFAICCEPSNLEIHIASSALVFVRLIVEGKGVHVSARGQMLFPQPDGLESGDEVAVDAFRKSLPLIDYINRLEIELNHRYRDPIMGRGGKPGHDKQGVGVFTINPSDIRGGEYLGTIPSRMEYTFAIWYPDLLISRDELLDEIRAGIQAISSTDDWLRKHPPIVEAPVIQDWPGFHVDENEPGVQALRSVIPPVTGVDAVISGFKAVCDAYYLNRNDVKTIVLGPGAINNSVHGDNEFIVVDDLVKATKIYAGMAMEWCEIEE